MTGEPLTSETDIYFSADVETDGPIPGPYSMLSFALIEAGRFGGDDFTRPGDNAASFYAELKPISDAFQPEALAVSGLDRERLLREGGDPSQVMMEATDWIQQRGCGGSPILVAYPLSFDWMWLYWYFVRFGTGSPFSHSRCFDVKTALAVKGRRQIVFSGRDQVPSELRGKTRHSHHALTTPGNKPRYSRICLTGTVHDQFKGLRNSRRPTGEKRTPRYPTNPPSIK